MPLLSQRTLRRILTLATLTLLSATLALAQETPQPGNRDFATKGTDNWSYAATLASSQKKLLVVTTADPTHRHTCHVRSITADQLICKGPFGVSHTYQSQEIAALIIPAKYRYRFKRHFDTGDKVALGATILGAIAVAGLGSPRAAGAILGAVFVLSTTDAVLIAPDQLLYLAPGQTVQVKLRY